MAQAETHNITRRKAILAAGALATGTALAAIPADAANHPDAELLALGRKFDAFEKQIVLSEAAWNSEDEARQRVTVPHPDAVVSANVAVDRAILALPATTLAGLAVKARQAAFYASSYWNDSDEDADWDMLLVRKLIDNVIAVASRAT